MKIVWREWYEPKVVTQLEELGTLSRDEIELLVNGGDEGEDVAQMIAKYLNSIDGEQMREGGRIVILEPERYAGTYDITVDYEPVFSATSYEDETT